MDWGESETYCEEGITPSAAINKHGVVVEVHQGKTGYSLWYRVGVRCQDNTIDWGSSSQYDLGKRPRVAINNDGDVVAVHQSQDSRSLMYRSGKVDAGNKIVGNKIVGWHQTKANKYDNGIKPAVAINDDGIVVEVHKTGTRYKNSLYYHIGNLKKHTISFTGSTEYGTGSKPSVAMNSSGQVIEVHISSGDQLHYSIGNITEKKMFHSHRRFDSGLASSVALTDSGHIFEVHRSQRNNTLWFHEGMLTDTNLMGSSRTYGENGASPFVAAASTGSELFVVEVHESDNSSSLCYHCTQLDISTVPAESQASEADRKLSS